MSEIHRGREGNGIMKKIPGVMVAMASGTRFLLAIVIAVFMLYAVSSAATEYKFTKIADSSQFQEGFFGPAINGQGVVAFKAALNSGGRGIFTGNGGPLTKIVDTTKTFGSIG